MKYIIKIIRNKDGSGNFLSKSHLSSYILQQHLYKYLQSNDLKEELKNFSIRRKIFNTLSRVIIQFPLDRN